MTGDVTRPGLRGTQSTPLKIDHDIGRRLRAADQHIASSRRLDRIELIADVAGYERRLAVVADTGAARPSHGHIACLCKFEQALERRTPLYVEAAACERYERS